MFIKYLLPRRLCVVSSNMSELKVSHVKLKQKTSIVQSDSTSAAQQLLKNGILVETNAGLICMSLNDALNEGVGGVSLSEEDFQNVAARLLSFEESADQMLVAGAVQNDENVYQDSDCDSIFQVKPMNSVMESERVSVRKRPKCTSTGNERMAGPSMSAKAFSDQKLMFDTDEVDSVLVSDSGLSSDTSEIVPLFNASTTNTPLKRRGGWPKGRKRTPENKSEIRQPKAPATGYVIFLNERRKEYKDLRFTEVTKLLGNEWSKLSLQEKRPYLIQAEVEKKRYREELKTYRQSEAYRQYLQRRRGKRKHGHGTEESDMDATDEIDDDEESEELYCRACDQWFHSLHNKKEHMYGRQHFANIAGRGKDDWPVSTSLDESSLDGVREDAKEAKTRVSTTHSVEDAMLGLVATTLRREREVTSLRCRIDESEVKNHLLLETLRGLNKTIEIKTNRKQNEERRQSMLEQRINNLRQVSTTFRP